MLVLGLESSCDETAAAVVCDGTGLLSSVVSSQIADHSIFGGVVPEIASRKHLEAVADVVDKALSMAGISYSDLDGIAVTQGPGLIGSLLVGFSFAKAFAYASGLKWTGVDHLHGHIMSVFLEDNPPEFPFVALLVSGGHTSLYFVRDFLDYEIIGRTRDDAAGEAFDKVSKMLGLGYPGGQIIDKLSSEGDCGKYVFPRAWLEKGSLDFSFSGLKSSVRREIEKTGKENLSFEAAHIAGAFQESVIDVLIKKSLTALEKYKCKNFVLCGGVSANSGLRASCLSYFEKKNIKVFMPSLKLCGDNAAMIACAGYYKMKNNYFSDFEDEVYTRFLSV